KTAQKLLCGCALPLMEYGHLPHFASWSRAKGGDFDAELQKRCKTFPDDLLKAVESREGADYQTAIAGLATYASLARLHATLLGEKALPRAAGIALAPHADRIRKALAASLQAKSSATRLLAALALLCLDERHAKANEVLQASAASADAEVLER